MTKLIAILMIVAALYGGWELFLYWDKINNEKEAEKKKAASAVVDPNSLEGMPYQLRPVLQKAEEGGPAAMREFLRDYDRSLQDPMRAWVQLDYCVKVAREDPNEARRVFAAVKERTSPASPVWPRIKQLEQTYQ